MYLHEGELHPRHQPDRLCGLLSGSGELYPSPLHLTKRMIGALEFAAAAVADIGAALMDPSFAFNSRCISTWDALGFSASSPEL